MPPSTNDTSVGAVLQCAEILTDDQSDHNRDSREITEMTIYRRSCGDGEQWKHLARVSTATPTEDRVADGRRISGELTKRQAKITVRFLKAVDYAEAEFSCVTVFGDINGQNTVVKSYVGRQNPSELEPHFDNKDQVIASDSKPLSAMTGHSPAFMEVKQLLSSLWQKLNCMEKRFEDSAKRDDKLEEELEGLKSGVTDKINNLGSSISNHIESSRNGLEDRLDRLENRLEDKISEPSLREPYEAGNTNSQNTTNYRLNLLFDSVQSTQTTLKEIHDQVKVAATCSSSGNNSKLASGTDSFSTIKNDLLASLESLRPVCAGKASVYVDEFFDVLGTGKKEWRLAFRGTAYNNVKIYPAYIHGTGIPVDVEPGCKQFNHSLPCTNHYRNRDAFENWSNIDEVLLAVFNKGQMVKRIVFNGHGSTLTSWYEASRLVLSSWSDMKTQSHNIFSIEGETRPQYMRRFFINHDYTTCDKFRGWFFVGEADDGGCIMDKTIARPFIQFAAGNSMAVWQSSDVARADAFGVFLKYD